MKRSPVYLIALLLSLVAVAEEPQPDAALKKNLIVELGAGVTMEFVVIQPGTFQMSGKLSAHKVTLTRPYYLGKYEVTQEQWESVMGSNPSHFKGKTLPVETVSWEDCQVFLRKVGEKAPGQTFRLPTEAEWEYACRAGSTTAYCYGNAESDLDQYGWYVGDSGGKTHPVGEKKPNAWNLYDMHGNVWEWCADWYGDYPKDDVTDPTGPSTGTARVTRGGEWNRHANHATSAFRGKSSPKSGFNRLGVRIVVNTR